jgi:hypothetical protein
MHWGPYLELCLGAVLGATLGGALSLALGLYSEKRSSLCRSKEGVAKIATDKEVMQVMNRVPMLHGTRRVRSRVGRGWRTTQNQWIGKRQLDLGWLRSRTGTLTGF